MRAAALSLLALAALFVTPTPRILTTTALAADDALAEIERLADEGEKWFREAGDTDAPNADRKKARKEAYARLKKARKLLDDLLDADQSRVEELDSLYSRITMMLFWVKKEAAIGELEGGGPVIRSGPPGKSPSGKSTGGAKKSGIGGSSRGAGDPGKPPPEDDSGTGTGESAPPPKDAPPAAPAGPTPAEELAEITAYESAHPGDVPGLHDLYTAFLAAHPDPSLAEYGTALTKREALDRKLKDVYRTLRDDDPAELAEQGDAAIGPLVEQLVEDLKPGHDQAVRIRAADYLGSLGSTIAVKPLLAILREEKGGVIADSCAEALAAIGGRVTCNRLIRMRADEFMQGYVVEILGTVVQRGGPEGRIAGENLAEYVLKRDASLQAGAVESLHDAGSAGALGLAMLVHTAPAATRADLIQHVGKQGDPRTAGYLARFMKAGVSGVEKKHARAARSAIESFGKPCVKYLIPALDDKDSAVWTAEMLRRLTGAKPKNDKRKTWARWYGKHRREFK